MDEKAFLQHLRLAESDCYYYRELYQKCPDAYCSPVRSWEDFCRKYVEEYAKKNDRKISFPKLPPTIIEDRFREDNFFPLFIPGDVAVVVNARFCPPFLHTLDFIKLICVYRGNCSLYYAGKWTLMREGNFCIVAPDVWQTVFSSGEEDIVINFLIRRSTFSEAFREFLEMDNGGVIGDFFWRMLYRKPEGEVLLFRRMPSEKTKEIVRELYREAFLTQIRSPLIQRSLILSIFSLLMENNSGDVVNLKNMQNKAWPAAVYMRCIHRQMDRISLPLLAEEFSLSEGWLSRYLKKETGSTFSQLLREARLNRARQLLLRTDCSIKRIIQLVGYQDESIFFRNFKARYGLTPSVFRKRHHIDFVLNMKRMQPMSLPAALPRQTAYHSGMDIPPRITRELDAGEKLYKECWKQNPAVWEEPAADWAALTRRCHKAGIRNVPPYPPTPIASSFQEDDFFGDENTKAVCFENSRYCPPFIHQLEFIKIVYVYSGRLTLYLNNVRYELQSGNFCVITPGIVHTVFSCGDEDRIYNLLMRFSTFLDSFSGILLEQNILSDFFWKILYTRHSNRILMFNCSNDFHLDSLIVKMAEEDRRGIQTNKLLMESYAMAFTGTIMRDHLSEIQIPVSPDEKVYRLPDIIDYMRNHLQDAELDTIGVHFGMKEDELKYYIITESGYSYKNLLRDLRLRKAVELLMDTNLSMERIMEETGYTNMANFYKSFREKYGRTPSEYRRSGELLL